MLGIPSTKIILTGLGTILRYGMPVWLCTESVHIPKAAVHTKVVDSMADALPDSLHHAVANLVAEMVVRYQEALMLSG